MKRFNYRRPGRPRKNTYQFWGLVNLLLVVCLILIAIGYYTKYESITYAQTVVADTVAQKQSLEQQVASLSAKESQAEKELLAKQLKFSSSIVTPERVKAISRYYIHKYFPQTQWANAEKVATCESNLSPLAENDKNSDGSVDRGVFQLNSVHAHQFQAEFNVPMEVGAFDAEKNVQFAYQMWQSQGFHPWVCSALVGVK